MLLIARFPPIRISRFYAENIGRTLAPCVSQVLAQKSVTTQVSIMRGGFQMSSLSFGVEEKDESTVCVFCCD